MTNYSSSNLKQSVVALSYKSKKIKYSELLIQADKLNKCNKDQSILQSAIWAMVELIHSQELDPIIKKFNKAQPIHLHECKNYKIFQI